MSASVWKCILLATNTVDLSASPFPIRCGQKSHHLQRPDEGRINFLRMAVKNKLINKSFKGFCPPVIVHLVALHSLELVLSFVVFVGFVPFFCKLFCSRKNLKMIFSTEGFHTRGLLISLQGGFNLPCSRQRM